MFAGCRPEHTGPYSVYRPSEEWQIAGEKPRLRIEATLEIDSLTGPRGTVFEYLGADGVSVIGLGFANGFNTYRSMEGAPQLFARDTNTGFEVRSIGKPDGWYNGYFITGAGLSIQNKADGVSYASLTDEGELRSLTGIEFSQLQLALSRREMTLPEINACAKWTGRYTTFDSFKFCLVTKKNVIKVRDYIIAQTGIPASWTPIAYIQDEVLITYLQDESGAFIGYAYCRLNDRLEPEGCRNEPFDVPNEFFYAFASDGDRVLATTNVGTVWEIRNDAPAIRLLKGPDYGSRQLYASLHTGNALVWGEYPQGAVAQLDSSGFNTEQPQLPIDAYRNKVSPELQSFAIYKGQLFAGLWPFGLVFHQDHIGGAWKELARLFSGPPIQIPGTTEPFLAETGSNELGQRVSDMAPMGDSLYVATSAKKGLLQLPNGIAPDDPILQEYGQVFRIRSSGAFTGPVLQAKLGQKVRYEVRLYADHIELFQNRRHIGGAKLEGPLSGCPSELKIGTGTWGELYGAESTVVVTEDHLGCSDRAMNTAAPG